MLFRHLAHVEFALGVVQSRLQVAFLVAQHAIFRRHSVLFDLQPFHPVGQVDYSVLGLLVQLSILQKRFSTSSTSRTPPVIYCVLSGQLVDEPLHRVFDPALGRLDVPIRGRQAHGQGLQKVLHVDLEFLTLFVVPS